MIVTIGCTQFVFLSLGILALNVLLNASGYAPNVTAKFPSLSVELARHGLWMFCIPFAWVAFAAVCAKIGTRSSILASKASGVGLTIAIFLLYFYASVLLF